MVNRKLDDFCNHNGFHFISNINIRIKGVCTFKELLKKFLRSKKSFSNLTDNNKIKHTSICNLGNNASSNKCYEQRNNENCKFLKHMTNYIVYLN